MTPGEIIKWALSRGWELDEYGSLRKEWNHETYRLKLGKKRVRHEVKHYYTGSDGKPKHEWMRLGSGYYKDLSISEEGKLTGLRRPI